MSDEQGHSDEGHLDGVPREHATGGNMIYAALHGMRPCPQCGDLWEIRARNLGWIVHVACLRCYDGAPDAPGSPEGAGRSIDEAIDEWNLCAEEWRR